MSRRRHLYLATLPSLAVLFFIFFTLFGIRIKPPGIREPDPITALQDTRESPHKQFSLLIGILTHPEKHDQRHFLRLVYSIQSSPIAKIDVKFIFCSLTKEEQKIFIALEIIRFNDIIVLNCTENMNNGKTYTYFSTLPRILPPPHHHYDYVMKADDDVFIRLERLAVSLQPLPRFDMYYGFVIPCTSMNPFVDYMSGMGFVLSWDLIEWIANSSIIADDINGPEDKLVGKWLNAGDKANHRFSNKPGMYDYPGTNGKCSHELVADTIAVHRLKKWDQWLHVLKFFNVTKQLKPSRFYTL